MNPLIERIKNETEICNRFRAPVILADMDRYDHQGMLMFQRRLYACLNKLGVSERREEKLALMQVLLNRRLNSTKDMTQNEVHTVCVEIDIHAEELKAALERMRERIA